MGDDLTTAIRENASAPAEASVDGNSVKQQPLPDQIEADRYLASKSAAQRKLGVKLTQVLPPGGA